MKKLVMLCSLAATIMACNNDASTSDSVEKADSANEVKQETSPLTIQTDEATTDFLVKAADCGLTEIEAGKLGQEKATNEKVKSFASMLVNDHNDLNSKVKSLASARNVSIPSAPSEEHAKDISKTGEKKAGKDFDKAFMSMTIDDHKKTIDLFEKTFDKSNDSEVKTFINNTLPKLKTHLESAEAIQKEIK